ncbi:MAG: FkbM family methyltransferase, partial [Snowella sp.]
MDFSMLFKPEYFYQPKIALQRLNPFKIESNDEFVDKTLPWGMNIKIRPKEEHGKILSTLCVIDLMVTETLWRLAEPGELTIDVGANIGYMTAVLAARVGSISGGSVWSFEAHPDIFSELKFNVERWQEQLKTVQFFLKNVAVSEQKGTVQLQIPDAFAKNRGLASVVPIDEATERSIVVESYSLDDLFLQSREIGVMKLDVEGHELQVLKGAKQLFQQQKIRDCVFEEHREYPTPVTNFFEDMGYKIFRIQRSFFKPLLLSPDSKIPRTVWEPTSFIA